MSDVLVLALLRFPWGHGLRRGLPWPNLHPSLFIGADDATPVLEDAQGLEIEGTKSVRFRRKVRIVAVEPRDTARRFAVCFLHNAPEAGATHAPGVTRREGGQPIVETPACGSAVVRHRFTRGHRHHFQPC
jgi:hypothetical protein